MSQRKVLVCLGAAVVVLAVAAYAGSQWLRYRVEREIGATFAAMRTPAGPATYGRARFDPWTRTVRIGDIVLPAHRDAAPPLRIGELVLADVPLFPGDRIAARRVELTKAAVEVAAARTIRIDSVVIDDLDIGRAIDWQRLRAVGGTWSDPPDAVPQSMDVLPVVADMLQGIRFGRLEMRGLVIREGASGFDIASVRLDGAADGRLAALTIRGVNSVALPEGKVGVARVALEKLDLAGLLRKAGRLSAADRAAHPDEIAAILATLRGVEMDDVVLPALGDHMPGAVMAPLSMRVSWGQFVGALPAFAHCTVKVDMPIGNEFGAVFPPLAGRKSLTLGFDVASTWTEQTGTLVLSPATFEFDTLFSASLTLSIANVSPNLLVDDPVKAPLAAGALEAGAVGLSVHDSGGLDVLVAQAAKAQAISASAARAKMVDDLRVSASMQPRQSPEFRRLVDEFARFLAVDGATLKIRLTPKGRVNLVHTLELARTDPIGVLSRFAVEASLAAE